MTDNIDAGDLPTNSELLGDIEAFCHEHKTTVTRLGREAMNNPAIVHHMRKGRGVTLETAGKLYKYMKDYDAKESLK